MRELGLLIKPAGGDCNIACTYCFYYTKPEDLYPGEKIHRMSLETLTGLMERYLKFAGPNPAVCWQGGEPTLMGLDFFVKAMEIQRRFVRPGAAVNNSLQTNGILINDDWAKFFKQNNFLIGLSMDGPAEVHNRYRKDKGGNGTFDRVMRAKEIFDRHGVDYNILTVVNDQTAKKARAIYEFNCKNNLRYMQFIPCLERDQEKKKMADFAVSGKDYRKFLIEMFYMWATRGEYGKRGDKKVKLPDCYNRMFDELLIVYAGYTPLTCCFRVSCGNYLLIEYNGDVYPCDFMAEERWRLGNILKDSFEAILNSRLNREFLDLKRFARARCMETGCDWLKLCNGGCPLHYLDSHGNPAERNYYCEAYQDFFIETKSAFQDLLKMVPGQRNRR